MPDVPIHVLPPLSSDPERPPARLPLPPMLPPTLVLLPLVPVPPILIPLALLRPPLLLLRLSVDDANGVSEGPESDTTDTPESVRSAGARRELLRLPLGCRRPKLPPSLLVPV